MYTFGHFVIYEFSTEVAIEVEVNIVSIGNCGKNVLFKLNFIYGLVGWVFVSHVKCDKKLFYNKICFPL